MRFMKQFLTLILTWTVASPGLLVPASLVTQTIPILTGESGQLIC